VSISSDVLSAAIDPLGAQLSVLKNREALDLLWDGDPAVRSGRAPLLFPIVGVLAGGTYRLGSKTYQLPRHGFARGKQFSIESTSSSDAVFRLVADQASLQVYPFQFELEVRYDLKGATLSVIASIRNQGNVDMPASFGYHPGFRWPLPFGQGRSSHFIEFESEEPAPARRIDSAGLLTPERQNRAYEVVRQKLYHLPMTAAQNKKTGIPRDSSGDARRPRMLNPMTTYHCRRTSGNT